MSRSAYLAKLLEDVRKGRMPTHELETPEMKRATELAAAMSDNENFGESAKHGFPGGGAQSSLVQPAELLAGPVSEFVARPAAEAATSGALSRLGNGLQAFRDANGLSQYYTAAGKAAEDLGEHGGQIGLFHIAPGEGAQAVTSAKNLAEASKRPVYERLVEAWRGVKDPGYRPPAALEADKALHGLQVSKQGVRTTGSDLLTNAGHVVEAEQAPEFNEALIKAKQALVPEPGPVPVAPGSQEVTTLNPGRPSMSAPKAAAGKIAPKPGESPHPAGYSPKEVVNKQKELLEAFFKAKGVKKYAKGGTVYDKKEAQRVAEEARLHAEATPVVPRIPSHADYRAADPVTLNKRGVTDAPVHRMRTIEPKVQHLPPLALPLDFAEAKPHEKDFDGVSQHLAHGGEVYHCAADAVHNYAFGGIAGIDPEEHVARPVAPALRGPATGVPEQKVTGVAIGQPQDIVGYGDFGPVTIDSEEDQGPDQQKLAQAATVQEAKSEGPNALDEIERQRRQDLADARPGTGSKIARVLSSALLGFAGKPSIDFDASDKAARDEINTEASNRKAAYLGSPGEQAGRDMAIAESPISGRLRNLVGTITGKPELAAGMSATELHGATPLVQDYLQAVRAGDMQRIQVAKLALEESHNAVTERQGDERNRIADRMADAAMLRSGKTDKAHEDDVVSKYLNAQSSARNAPAYAQLQKDELAIDKIEEVLQKPVLDTDDVTKLKVELAKIASGGEGSQHIQDELGSPTLRTKAALAYRYLTGQPADAGYKDIVEKSIKPYLMGARKVLNTSRSRHDAEFLQKWLPLLPPDFAATEKARIEGPRPGGAPLPDASFENSRKNDPFAEFGGHAE